MIQVAAIAGVILAAIIGAISDDVLVSINTIECVAIVYLAIAISDIRERLSKLEGRLEERGRQLDRDASGGDRSEG